MAPFSILLFSLLVQLGLSIPVRSPPVQQAKNLLTFRPLRNEFPMPPFQTDNQKAIFAQKQADATVASTAATPVLLALLDEADVRSALHQCCPSLADVPSPTLLERLRAEVAAAEIAHTLPAGGDDFFTDVTVALLSEFDWFLNPWQVRLVDLAAGGSPPPVNILELVAEPALYGCPAFKNATLPTWTEAADR
jgi:hypothetical protein